ncbi:MAG: hypothetical protein ACLP50_23050 [Solirubrobacteraceae bacterium]
MSCCPTAPGTGRGGARILRAGGRLVLEAYTGEDAARLRILDYFFRLSNSGTPDT